MRILWVLLFLSFNIMAAVSLKEKLYVLLPAPLGEFKVQKTTLAEVQKAMGKAHLVEGENHYWERDGLKYALELSFNDKGVLKSIHYTFTGNKPSLEKLGTFDQQKLTPAQSSGKFGSRHFVLKEKDSEVTIDPVAETIYSVKIL